jgi:hypothetical protein
MAVGAIAETAQWNAVAVNAASNLSCLGGNAAAIIDSGVHSNFLWCARAGYCRQLPVDVILS